MKFKFLILLLCSITGCSQQTVNSITPSSWIGKIKMGDANPELVFNIFTDSLGQLAGNLGIPSKGIQGIPLSKVYINQDSIVLEISAAQASYKGVFENNRKTINGIWTEPQSTYPLILEPLTKEIDFENLKKENTSSLNLEFASEHFNFYSKEENVKVLENLSETLESNYSRITKDMQTSFNSKIDVFIYPDLKAFHSAISYPDAPDWVVGAASKNELKMVSPLKPGSVHTYESLMKAIVHELAHTVVLNFRKQGLVGLPNWLNEGYAYYEAKQLTESQREIIHSNLLKNAIPSWNELEKANTTQFGDMGGYVISTTIIEFLVESYGRDKLKQYIIEPESVEKIYNISKEGLENLWLQHLKQD
ncbi:peptidase MA family metallohydrolase [Flavobacteriaceae bacterium KMM 6898]|nr:peptidase MA family metallohydrolase [Flavobacteriaceae bacterium KMM 6898]